MRNDKGSRSTPHEERDQVQFGDTTIQYTVTRSRRRKKTIEIALERGSGVHVAAPIKVAPERIRQIVLKRASWIVRKATQEVIHPRRKEFVSGESLLYLGHEARVFVECATVRRVSVAFEHPNFHISVPVGLDGEDRHKAIQAAVMSWYRARAGECLVQRVEQWSKIAGLTPTEVLVRDQRRRWGSCSPDGKLRFNWHLIMTPPALIDYVVLHEILHLRIRNHSAAFWAEMARLMPDCKVRRSVLREMGPRLTI